MSAVETRGAAPAESQAPANEVEHRGPPSYALQAVASSVCTVLGELLGSSTTGKLVAGILGAWVGAFLTAPGRRQGRRIVAVALLLLLLDAGRALAAGVRRRKPARPRASASSALPAGWTAVAAATAAGFVIGTGVTAAGHAVAGDGVRLTSAHHQQQASPPQPQQQTQTTQQQLTSTQQQNPPTGNTQSTDVTIPSVSGRGQAAALAALKGAGLRPVASSRISRSVPSGDAIGTEPAAGTKVRRGSRVTLLVSTSTGVEKVTVPSVTGQSVRAATALLKAAGLTWSISADEACAPGSDFVCAVDSQTPAAGASVPSGTTVTLHEAASESR